MESGWRRIILTDRVTRFDKNICSVHGLAEDIYRILSAIYGTSPWTLPQVVKDIEDENNNYFIIKRNDKLLAFLSSSQAMDEIEITNLAVLPTHQRQGLASSLLDALLAYEGLFFLEVRESNIQAIKLYETYKFEEYHRRKKYYKNPQEDAILMKLRRE